jgi:hypothetical protein
MRTMKKLIGVFVGLTAVFGTGIAHANIYACNHTTHDMWVLQGLWGDQDNLNCYDNTGNHVSHDIEWEGWYYAAPNSCVTMYSGCYNPGALPYVGFYAVDSIGEYWAGAGLNGQYTPLVQGNNAFQCCVPPTPGNSPPIGVDTCSYGKMPNAPLSYAGPAVMTGSGTGCLGDFTRNFVE